MTRILITGATGLLGPYLAEATAASGTVVRSARTGGALQADLTDPRDTRRLVDEVRPDLVLNCAAMTNVDACEAAPQAALALNRDGVAHLAAALPADAQLVQFSTDQVYPDDHGPHREGSEAPVNVYGRSKLAGEAAALRRQNSLVLRVNFFGPSLTAGRASFSDWIIESLRSRTPISIFTDSLFSPLHLRTLAETVRALIERGARGVFNLGCRAGASKCEFALAIARHLNLPGDRATPALSSSLPGRAPRPGDLRMDVGRVEAALGSAMPTLEQEIAKLAEARC